MGFESFSFPDPNEQQEKEPSEETPPAEAFSEVGASIKDKENPETESAGASEAESFESKEKNSREKIRGMLAAGALTMLSGCATQNIENPVDALLEKADNPQIARFVEAMNEGVSGECENILPEKLKSISRELPNEWEFVLEKHGGQWYIVGGEEGTSTTSSMVPDVGYSKESWEKVEETCDIHSHPLESLSEIYQESYWHSQTKDEPLSDMSREVVENQEKLIEKSEIPTMFFPPSVLDISKAVMEKVAFNSLVEQGFLPNLEKTSLMAFDPSGTWKVEVVSNPLNDIDAPNFENPLKMQGAWIKGHTEPLARYAQMIDNAQLGKPYSKSAYEAFQEGDETLVQEEYEKRKAVVEQLQDALEDIGINITFTSYEEAKEKNKE